ncbi:MAG: DoxX family membrane protein [Saprospiraceae bacterium]|nr:DoxX family membrane protein [Saprospiraceae bacterium]
MVKQARYWVDRHIIDMLRMSIGICYVWFGMLKFFPHLSPAEDLAGETITLLTFGLVQPPLSLNLLAIWEVGVGLMFMSNRWMRFALWAMFVHMICTLTPAFLIPDAFFTHFPYGLTLVGQYIIKNFVFIAVAIALMRKVQPVEEGMEKQS